MLEETKSSGSYVFNPKHACIKRDKAASRCTNSSSSLHQLWRLPPAAPPQPSVLTALDAAITKAMRPLGYNRSYYRGSDYICFEDAHFQQFSNWAALPAVELKFNMGVILTLQPQSSFHFHNDYGLCTYFMRDASLGSDVQLLGNTMTRSVVITFDIQGDQFAFRKGDC